MLGVRSPLINASWKVNNQMVYPSAQMSFGKGSLLGYLPWHSTVQLHIVAAAEPPSAAKPTRQASLIKQVVGALGASEAFREVDADGSGGVSKEELAATLRKQAKMEVDPVELDELFSLMDTDGSGDISAKEFDAAFYAARLAGGVDVYIPFPAAKGVGEMIAKYEGEAFKQALLHGWRKPVELM